MNCSKCGAQNIDGVTFCGSCGTQMDSHIPKTPENLQQNFQSEGSHQQQPSYGQQTYNTTQGNMSGSPYNSFSEAPYNGGMVMPKNYMVESIVVTVLSLTCCCSPISAILGIIAIIKANNVNQEFVRGNVSEAISCSETAKNLTVWAAIIMVIFFIIGTIYTIFWGTYLTTILQEAWIN